MRVYIFIMSSKTNKKQNVVFPESESIKPKLEKIIVSVIERFSKQYELVDNIIWR